MNRSTFFLSLRLDKHAEKKTEQFYFSQGK